MIVFDLVLATRRSAMTGVERYGVRLFEAVRAVCPDTVAFAHDDAAFSDRRGLILVSSVYGGWFNLPASIAKLGQEVEVAVFPTAPASPLFLLAATRLCRIVHDVFPWVRSKTMPLKGRLLYRDVENLMLRRYRPLLGTTQTVAEELRSVTGLPDVRFCGNGPGLDLHGPQQSIDGIPDRFVLVVGTVEPRKNYARLIEMIESDNPKALPVVLVGRPGWGNIVDAVAALAERKRKHFTWLRNMTGDDGLRWLYRRAACLVSLSEAEGFNMPLVEGAGNGRPVVCSDIPIHRAVAPPWARFVAADADPGSVWREIDAAAGSPPSRSAIETYSRKYSWDQVATSLLRELASSNAFRLAGELD